MTIIMGPAVCQGCRRKVYWTGLWWTHDRAMLSPHRCRL